MILDEIRLHPFGGIADRSISFSSGLNVLLGPNEAGKSTLVTALRKGLFLSTKLTPVRFRNELQAHLPIAGGDTLRVSLKFRVGNEAYVLDKCWTDGKGSSSRLSLVGGGELTDPDQVDHRMRALIHFTEGTYDNILSTTQTHLSGTMNAMQNNPVETTSQLADLLRRSVFHSDGVSPDKLKQIAGSREVESFSRWDRAAMRPEGGRDIDRPWKQGAGIILKAYYALRESERAYQQAEDYERKVDDYARRMAKLEHSWRVLEEFIVHNSALVEDARKRIELTRLLENNQKESGALQKVVEQWPRHEARLDTLGREIGALRAKYKSLDREYVDAVEFRQQAILRETCSRVIAVHAKLVEEQEKLKGFHAISEDDIRALREAEVSLKNTEIRLAARQFNVNVESGSTFVAKVTDSDGTRTISSKENEPYSAKMRGFVQIEQGDWKVIVKQADDGSIDLRTEHDKWQRRIDELRNRMGVLSSEEASLLRKSYDTQAGCVDRAQASLNALTKNEPFESFVKRIENLPPVSAGRTPEAITQEKELVYKEGTERSAEEKNLRGQCEAWLREYGGTAQILDLFATKKGEEKHNAQQLMALKPIPEEFENAAAFVSAYEQRKDSRETVKRELESVSLERARWEKSEPEKSRDELREEFQRCTVGFESAKAHGKAYEIIVAEIRRFLALLDADTTKPLHGTLEKYIQRVTQGRYEGVGMEGMVPVNIRRAGRSLPLNIISQGTSDVLALAVRLAMAEHALPEGDGFVLMDDPLVNMDPERQDAAAECMEAFANDRQMIILTCHPHLARMFKGDVRQWDRV